MESKVTTVATINQVAIQLIENGEKRVAVKPVCQALGIAYEPQFTRLKSDPILSSVITTSVTTGADGKQYEMVTIPLKYVFGWLFRIDSRNVKEEAREAVLKYQMQCYDALYKYFTRHEEYLEFRNKLIREKLEAYDRERMDFRNAKDRVQKAREELDEANAITEEDYFTMNAQLRLNFEEGA